MPVDLQQLQENISEDIRCKSIFLSLNMFLPEDVSHIFTAALCLCFPLPSHPCHVFDVLHNPAFGHSVF